MLPNQKSPKKNQNCATENYFKNRPRYLLLGFFLISVYTHSSMYLPEKKPTENGQCVVCAYMCEAAEDAGPVTTTRMLATRQKKQTHEKIFFLPILGFCIGGLHILCRPLLAGTAFFLYLLFTTEIRKNMGGCSKNVSESP